MLARNALIFKWSVYIGTIFLAIAFQGIVLQHIVLWGLIPFIYPALVAVMSTFEEAPLSAAYGLILGVMCDTLLPAPIPCFYTLLFPITAIVSSFIAKTLIATGFLCSGVVTVVAFTLSALFHCLILAARGKPAWEMGFYVASQELALSFLLMIPLTFMFRFIAERARYDD